MAEEKCHSNPNIELQPRHSGCQLQHDVRILAPLKWDIIIRNFFF
jgi:hypothetical protein